MTAVDHAELKRLAEGATPGPWNNSGRSVDDFDAECMMRMEWIANGAADDDDDLNANVENDAAFIAAANPAVVLALLSEIEGLKAERDEARASRKIISGGAMDMGAMYASACERADEAERQLSALRTQAPDSWRPEADELLCRWLGQSCDDDGVPELQAATRAFIKALRPQTAESGK